MPRWRNLASPRGLQPHSIHGTDAIFSTNAPVKFCVAALEAAAWARRPPAWPTTSPLRGGFRRRRRRRLRRRRRHYPARAQGRGADRRRHAPHRVRVGDGARRRAWPTTAPFVGPRRLQRLALDAASDVFGASNVGKPVLVNGGVLVLRNTKTWARELVRAWWRTQLRPGRPVRAVEVARRALAPRPSEVRVSPTASSRTTRARLRRLERRQARPRERRRLVLRIADGALPARGCAADATCAALRGNQPERRVHRDNSSLSHFSAMTRPSWLGRAARKQHPAHAVEQASRRWRGGRRDDSARTRRKILISTQARPSSARRAASRRRSRCPICT